jgi:hypothetical protein
MSGFLSENQEPRLARPGGVSVARSSLPERLLGPASSIPPSKKDDEPKNVNEYEHAEQPGKNRAHERLSGHRAALL